MFPVTAGGGGGSPDRVARSVPSGGQGSKVYVLCAEPKEHKHFRSGTRSGGSGTRPGGSVTGVIEKQSTCRMGKIPPKKSQHTIPDHVHVYPLHQNSETKQHNKKKLAALPFAVF